MRLVAAGDLTGDRERALAGRVELLPGLLQDRLPGAAEDHRCALIEEAACRGAADAAAPAGDENDVV